MMTLRHITTRHIKESIKAAFNKAENSYDDHCQLQQITGKNLIDMMSQHHISSENVIDLGCGTGIVTEKLADAIHFSDFHAIDFADELLRKAYERLSQRHIKTYSADFDHLPFYKHKFNIIFSNMALHWSEHLSKTLTSIRSYLADDGVFAFSIPLAGTFSELENKLTTNKFISEKKILLRLSNAGYQILSHDSAEQAFHFENTFAALKSIKLVGANYASDQTIHRTRGKKFFKNLNITSLTYVIGYFVVKKKDLP